MHRGELVKEYIITAAVAAVVAATADILAPKSWKGYIRIAVGFLILSVLFAPIAKFKGTELFLESDRYEISDLPLKDEVSRQLKENVEKDIEERLLEEFKIKAEVAVEIDVDEKHNITGVRGIKISARKNPEGMEERLRDVYGCERIEFSGNY